MEANSTNAKNSSTVVNNSAANAIIKTQTKRYKGLEYTMQVRVVERDFVDVSYEVKNTGKTDYLLFNRGDKLDKTATGRIYVDVKGIDTVELSQKKFIEPNGKSCPDRIAPILPGATWLKAGQTIKSGGRVSLPLKIYNPFDDCEPKSALPNKIIKAQFCLGAAEADAVKTKVSETGIVEGWQYIKEQQLLCSDIIELQ